MPSLSAVTRPMASPMPGSNPNSNVQLGVSTIMSRLVNSCTRMTPMSPSWLLDGFPVILHRDVARLEGGRREDLVQRPGPGGPRFEQGEAPGRRVVGEQPLAGADRDREHQQPV